MNLLVEVRVLIVFNGWNSLLCLRFVFDLLFGLSRLLPSSACSRGCLGICEIVNLSKISVSDFLLFMHVLLLSLALQLTLFYSLVCKV